MRTLVPCLAALLPASSNAFVHPPRSSVVATKPHVVVRTTLIQGRHRDASSSDSTSTATAVGAAASHDPDFYSFDKVKAVELRLKDLEREAPDVLTGFYEPHLKSFSVRPGSAKQISVTSTCFGLQTILSCNDIFSDYVDFNMKSVDKKSKSSKIPLRGVAKALLRASLGEEAYRVLPGNPLLLYTLLTADRDRAVLNSSMDEELCHNVKRLIATTIEYRPKRRDGIRSRISNYNLYRVTESLAELVMSTPPKKEHGVGLGGLPSEAIPDGAARDAVLALSRCAEVSYNELCRQMAFRSAGDMTSFDVVKLSYSLLAYVKACNAMAGAAGIEVTKDQGPERDSFVKPANRRLVNAALDAYFAEQNPDGTWDQGQPIYRSLGNSYDVGNAYVYMVETVASLLHALPAEDFRPHLAGLDRLLTWIESHQLVEIIPDYCDPETGQCYGKPLRGWKSPHIYSRSNSPAAWSTAQTLTCIIRMRDTVQKLLHDDVLEEFGGKKNGGVPNLASWDRLLDTDLGDPADGITLKHVITERMIVPRSDTASGIGMTYSAILFGPPGTAKSTICEALAERMGWDFLVIDTANFLEDGLTNVASRIRYVFTRLQSLSNCVILFDEIEEFCLDRETPGLGMESRMLTTSMLTQINDLRRAKKSIFFLATNRLRAFDSAIIRPGRFDMQLFVGTPNLESRLIQLRSALASLPASQSDKDKAEEAFRSFLSSVWEEDVMFFNYLEGIQFASACANVVATGSPLTEEKMAAILKAQATVMTVRGQTRDEYKASMGLSRL